MHAVTHPDGSVVVTYTAGEWATRQMSIANLRDEAALIPAPADAVMQVPAPEHRHAVPATASRRANPCGVVEIATVTVEPGAVFRVESDDGTTLAGRVNRPDAIECAKWLGAARVVVIRTGEQTWPVVRTKAEGRKSA